MENDKPRSPILKYLKSLKVTSTDEREIIETDTLSIGVIISIIKTKAINEENYIYSVGACFIDKINNKQYPFVFCKKFEDREKGYNYYHDIINKLKINDDSTIYEAMRKNDLSFL